MIKSGKWGGWLELTPWVPSLPHNPPSMTFSQINVETDKGVNMLEKTKNNGFSAGTNDVSLFCD